MPLSVKDGMGAWVKDFQDSNAPQFKGKSDKERREMAIAAYLSAKRGDRNESVEEAKRTVTIDKPDRLVSMKVSKDKPPFTPDPPKPATKNSDGTKTSPMSRAKQLAKKARDTQKVDEAKDMYKSAAQELKSYADKRGGMDKKDFHTAAKHIENIGRANIMNKGQHLAKFSKQLRDLDTSPREKVLSVLDKHGHQVGDYMPGVKMKRRAYEAVQVDELKKSTLGSYVKKAAQDAAAKAYSAAQKAMSNPDQSGKDYVKSVKRQKGIAKATDRLTNEAGTPERLAMIRKAGEKINKEKKKAERDAKRAMAKDKDLMGEAKSFDQKFKDHLKFATSKSPAVQAYMKKRKANRDAAHAKQDPAAVKKNYGPAVIPPGTAYGKASKRGMSPRDAANAVSTAFKNKAKRSGKLPG